MTFVIIYRHDAVLSQGETRNVAVNFDTNRILQRHRAVSLSQYGFLVGLYLQTAVNHPSTRSSAVAVIADRTP